jgi:hypothetical protein
MADDNTPGTYESKAEAVRDEQDFVKLWLDQIERTGDDEKEWREDAEKAEDIYRAKQGAPNLDFNIFHANIETVVPALYNSTPIPDVRRRFSDKDDVGKVVSDIIERSLSFAVDDYDFDGAMVCAIKDSEIVDRGVARVRYMPAFSADGQSIIDAKVVCEHVLWRDFRRGPGRFWGEVPWIAFRHFLSKDEMAKLIAGNESPIDIEQIPFNYSSDGRSSDKAKDAKADVFKRAMVWEIWDRDAGKVIFICQDYRDRVLKSEDDPLKLSDFFPVPKPIQAIEQTGSLIPVTPLKIYERLVDELNTVTKRISKLVKQLRPRGLYGGNAEDIKGVSTADDGELVPASDVMGMIQNGGLEKALSWFPLDPTINAVKVLYEQRDVIKQTIYEVTGIADILRGATNPNETLGAQELKAQWGSLRIQRRQSEVARFARDLFEIKAEIIATQFDWPMLSRMTGITLPSQAEKQQAQAMMQQIGMMQQQGGQVPPQVMQQAEQMKPMLEKPSQEEVMQLLQDDIVRNYRIDIESDSTIRNDLSRNQQTMNIFLQGTAQFATAMGPLIMTDPGLKPMVMEIYGSFARQFKLGRQAEDAIEKATEQAMATANQPPPPDPKIEAEKAKAENEKQKMALEMQNKQAENQMKMQMMQAEHQMKTEMMQAEMAIKREELQMKQQELAMKERSMMMDAQMDERKAQIDAQSMEHKAALDERTAELQAESIDHKHAVGMEVMEAKAKQAKAKPNGARK